MFYLSFLGEFVSREYQHRLVLHYMSKQKEGWLSAEHSPKFQYSDHELNNFGSCFLINLVVMMNANRIVLRRIYT